MLHLFESLSKLHVLTEWHAWGESIHRREVLSAIFAPCVQRRSRTDISYLVSCFLVIVLINSQIHFCVISMKIIFETHLIVAVLSK